MRRLVRSNRPGDEELEGIPRICTRFLPALAAFEVGVWRNQSINKPCIYSVHVYSTRPPVFKFLQ